MRVFGAAQITHGGITLGKTRKGGAFNLNVVTTAPIGGRGNLVHKVLSGEGTINMFEWQTAINVTNLLDIGNFAALVATTDFYTLTFHDAKLILPDGMAFGTNDHQPLQLGFFFRPDATGQLFTIT